MNLKMVTYELDDTQFLVDAETNEDAIQKAIPGVIALTPLLERTEKHNGVWITSTIMLTPGYVFLFSNIALDVRALQKTKHVTRVLSYVDEQTIDGISVKIQSYALVGADADFALWIFKNEGIIRVSNGEIRDGVFCITDGPLANCYNKVKRVDKHNRKALVCLPFDGKPLDLWLSFRWNTV